MTDIRYVDSIEFAIKYNGLYVCEIDDLPEKYKKLL